MERLQKLLSNAGVCSRRQAERLIENHLVTVNGKTAALGTKATREDDIQVKGERVEFTQEPLYFKAYKPVGLVSTCSTNQENSILQLMPTKTKLHMVGRLDKMSEGLLIFTNDGAITNKLTHPRYQHEKEYVVETKIPLTQQQVAKLKKGVRLEGKKTNPVKLIRKGKKKYHFILTEGKFQQIRRIVKKVGGKVLTLKRIRISNIKLGNLKPGETKPLTKKEINHLIL